MAQSEIGSSPLSEALARVGDRWTLLVVEALLNGPQRFNDLLGQVPGIAANILSDRLKRLEHDGLLVARPYSDRPPRAAYHLTADGQELAGALRLLAYWGSRHADPAQAPRHPACGTPIEARWYCPTCDRLVDHDPDHADVYFALSDNGVMASPRTELPDELAGHQVGPRPSSLVLPDGPRYPRIVQAWLWLKRPTWFLDRCSRVYGDVFTLRLPLGMTMVHFTRPELVKAVFGGDNEVLRAGEANATILEPLVGPHSVLVLDGPEHLRQRKLILPAFHGDRMRAWEAAVREITRAEIARWPVGQPFALRPSMQSITLDVIVRVVFGVDQGARRDELRRHILAVAATGRNPFMLFATRDRRLGPHAPWARFIRARDALDVVLIAEIRHRRHTPDLEQRSDVLSQLLLARDDEGRAMTDDEVRDELVTLLFAGHETTATSLAWAFDLLLHHPEALRRLVAELTQGTSEYLDATITETLRIRPVVALVDRHVRQPVRIGGHTIPAGATACPNIYLAQRRPDLYDDPAAFRPDRFIGQPPPSFGWFPFGGGIRRCLGASFATFEMRIVLPEVLQAVTLRPASPQPARIRREAVTFVPHDGARCVVTARTGPVS